MTDNTIQARTNSDNTIRASTKQPSSLIGWLALLGYDQSANQRAGKSVLHSVCMCGKAHRLTSDGSVHAHSWRWILHTFPDITILPRTRWNLATKSKKALDHESAVRTSEDVARSSDDRKSPRTFGVLRPLSPRKNSNARSHTHTHTHMHTILTATFQINLG